MKDVGKQRDSSIEMFRILATLAVIVVHYNGWFVGGLPESFDFSAVSSYRVGQLIIQALCVVCVNCFLLISGYFGIRLNFGSVLKFLLTLLGFYIPCCLLCFAWKGEFSLVDIVRNSLVISRGGVFCAVLFCLNAFIADT